MLNGSFFVQFIREKFGVIVIFSRSYVRNKISSLKMGIHARTHVKSKLQWNNLVLYSSKYYPEAQIVTPSKTFWVLSKGGWKKMLLYWTSHRNFIMTFWKGYRRQCATNYRIQSIKNIIKSMHQRMEEIA